MQDGFIYLIFNQIVKLGKFCNLVEYCKDLAQYIYKTNNPLDKSATAKEHQIRNEGLRQRANIALDIFIVAKWLLVAAFWIVELNNCWARSIVWYLIITNVFTYFYYHVWNVAAGSRNTIHRSKRRFLTVFLSMFFSIFCFAYFYGVAYASHYKWTPPSTTFLDIIYFSTASALTVTYGDVSLQDTTARLVSASQLVINYVFFLIIASSIPAVEKELPHSVEEKL